MNLNQFPELEEYRIDFLPYGLYYIPQFLRPEEEASLLDKVTIVKHFAYCRSPTNDGFNYPIDVFNLIHLLLQRARLSSKRR